MDFELDRLLLPSLDDVREIHRKLFKDLPPDTDYFEGVPGEIKKYKTCIPLPGTQYSCHCLPENVSKEYAALLEEMNDLQASLGCLRVSPSDTVTKIAKLTYIASFHARFNYIHPFADGNGRTNRALSVIQLFRLFSDDLQGFEVSSYITREFAPKSPDPLFANLLTHSGGEYLGALKVVDRNLMHLVRYFNIFFPQLPLPNHIAPPRGKLLDIRSKPG